MLLTDLGQDIVIEIGSFLDTVSLVRLLSVSKQLWILRLKDPSFAQRIQNFRKLLCQNRVRPYNDALIESTKKRHISDVFFLSIKVNQMYLEKIKLPQGERELLQWKNTMNNLWNDVMCAAAEIGNKDLIDFFIDKGAADWNGGLVSASRGGHKELVNLFIDKGADEWNNAMACAARGGHKDLVEFFIEKGADDWNWGMEGATLGGHKGLIDFFVRRGASDWVGGMKSSVPNAHQTLSSKSKELMEFFAQKGADWGIALVEGIRQGHIEDEFVDYVVQKGNQQKEGMNMWLLNEAVSLARLVPEIKSSEDLVARLDIATQQGYHEYLGWNTKKYQ